MLRVLDFPDGVNHWQDAKQLRAHRDYCKQMVISFLNASPPQTVPFATDLSLDMMDQSEEEISTAANRVLKQRFDRPSVIFPSSFAWMTELL